MKITLYKQWTENPKGNLFYDIADYVTRHNVDIDLNDLKDMITRMPEAQYDISMSSTTLRVVINPVTPSARFSHTDMYRMMIDLLVLNINKAVFYKKG